MAGGGRRDRWAGGALLGAVVLLTVGWWLTWTAPGAAFVPGVNYISDLGVTRCMARSGRWLCSPRHVVFNGASVVAGLTVVATATATLPRWGALRSGGFCCLGAGLIWIGAVPGGVWEHLVGAVAALPVAGCLLMVSGFRPQQGTGRPRAAAGLVALSCTLPNLVPGTPQGVVVASEYVSYLALMAITLVEGAALLGSSESEHP